MVTKESYNPSKPLLLLPAAGFGTRVGSSNVKEIFFGANGGPLIEASLHQARLCDWAVHVITRKEKTDLLNYLKEYQNKYFNPDQVDGFNISIQIIEPSREWPDTLLKSKDYWRHVNLLCLPDTIYEPQDVWNSMIADVQQALAQGKKNMISAGLFTTEDYSKWGVMKVGKSTSLFLCEKPQPSTLLEMMEVDSVKAWGLIAFSKAIGEKLFSAQLESTFDHQWKSLETDFVFHELSMFKDLTRGLY